MMAPSEKHRLAEFFRDEYLKLLGFVRRRVDDIAAQDAEDFVHDVAVQLFDKADIAAPIEHLSAYVYRSLQNRMADYFRRRKPVPAQKDSGPGIARPTLDHVVEASGYDSAPEIRKVEIAHDLYRLMDGLNDDEKRLIIATDIQGNTFSQLSKMWNVPVNTLLSRKSRALNKIQRQVQNKQKQKE
jgi:RNA polymerase sigma factor (sigma-70 family)